MNRWIKLAAVLMLISGVTHILQLIFYQEIRTIIGATLFGIIYFIIGIYLWRGASGALWAGAIFPTIGGVLGTYRLLVVHPNPFSAFHVAIDLIVVPICILALRSNRLSRNRKVEEGGESSS